MEYRIERDGATYGPYTEAEVREYLASGNLVETDLARTETMKKSRPLRKVLPAVKVPKVDPKALNVAGLRTDLPSPPDMPWGMALVLDIMTSLAFFVGWDIVEAWWLRRVQPNSRALLYTAIAGALLLLDAPAIYSSVTHGIIKSARADTPVSSILLVSSLALRVVARFSMRKSLLTHFNITEPVGLKLSWFMTLVFGGLYFQYHFNRVNEAKRTLAAVEAKALEYR